ncbi:5'-(N(7)-methyl 5'-triphosphoguanosine)-(mRNA) diphosphatase [Parelaphostrongylus tenuis]|uniref:m7GpppX diphosphatase n=1 Tax=Parelaphostrongylus tenuis TaxID=148309 RepID=A0AAD5NBY0_PARTN|nr:5'-(N(7)-methyl 5'-triphosphoguanosine)-(mRNA) diphosphatase [Parelaphostrongylus tenuis]
MKVDEGYEDGAGAATSTESAVSGNDVAETLKENAAQVWLRGATFREVLGSDASHKSLFVLLSGVNGEQGVLLLNKSAFSEDTNDINAILRSVEVLEVMKNDIYGNYNVVIPAHLNMIKSQFIHPANEKIIAKYRQEEKFIINETAEDYRTITVEYIEKYQMDLKWVYNILSKQSEAERILFEDPDPYNGFILSPDIKWDGVSLENLYVLAIIHRRGVRSIRDLTADDLPLLENLRKRALSAIREKFGVRPDQIRAYFHYQPSFYHLHVHFVSLKYEAPASSTLAAVLLDDVINNLTIAADYYKRATLSFTRKNSDKLLQMFREAGRCEAV